MQSRAIVIGDVVPQRTPELADGVKGSPMDDLRLERVEERFHVRVSSGAPARHALHRAGPRQTAAHGQTEILAAPVAMKDQTRGGMAPSQGRRQHGLGETRRAGCTQTPGQDPTRILIEDRGEMPPTPGDREIREVAHPDLIAAGGLGATDTIWMLAEPAMGAGGPTIEAGRAPRQPWVRIKRSTRRRLTRYPSAWSARCIRGPPYVPPLWSKIGRIARIRR